MFYVYFYLRENRTPYYVGKGSGKRINSQHRYSNGKLLPLPPLNRRFIVKHFDNENEAFLFEEWLISFYGRKEDGGILINQCKGGGGYTRGKRKDHNEMRKKWKKENPNYDKDYRERNKKILKEKQKNKYQRRKEKDGSYWYKNNNKEEYNEKQREMYIKKREDGYNRYEKQKEYQKEYRNLNKEKMKEYHRNYYQKKKLEKIDANKNL